MTEEESFIEIEEESFVEEMTESVSEPVESELETAHDFENPATTADDTIEVIEEHLADVPHSEQTSIGYESGEYESAESTSDATESSDLASADSEPDATASHHIDPVPPSGFRLFGLGGKKKKGDEHAPATEAPVASSPAKAVASASTFAPGTGLVEEEVIEGEEFEAPGHHHHKGDEHDLDEYEEETLQNQIRSGELGEMLQEAHLDHRIQLDFDEKNGEEEEEGEEEGEEPVIADGQAAGAPRPQRDRGGRGRRGRGGPGGQGQGQGNRRGPSRRSAQTSDLPVISDLLKPGQEILVQIAKEPIAKKGARITSHIALPGRFLVFMPTVSHVGVSRKIASEDERHRLKRVLTSERGEASGGFIVRTAAEGASEEELRSDLRFLIHLWDEIEAAFRDVQVARPHLSRPVAHRAHSARPGERQFLVDLG